MNSCRALILASFVAGLCSAQSVPTPANRVSPQASPSVQGQVPFDRLVREVVYNELNAPEHTRWMYRDETPNPSGSKNVDEVVETTEGNLKRPLLIDGHEPSAKQDEEAERHLRQLERDPSELRKLRQQHLQDQKRSADLFKLIPDAFIFTYAAEQGDLVKLNFVPNPRFNPPTREAEVFHQLEGYVWIDRNQKRLSEISGHLVQEVKFFGGLLGHLDKGGTFDVKKEQVAAGEWKLTRLNVNMTGKALFFKTISARQDETRCEFQRVPDNLTIAQGANMLESVTSQLRASK